MPNRIVIDTGPLISLAAGGVLHLLRDLPHDFLVPEEVRLEIETGERVGRARVDLSGVKIVESSVPVDAVTMSLLGRGEAAVIHYALHHEVGIVCIDEKKGRRIARAVDLEVVGTLGLLLEAKKLGLLEAIAPIVERLRVFGIWFDRQLLERVLTFTQEPLLPKRDS
jgi:predicted nucleic acid-binding protein